MTSRSVLAAFIGCLAVAVLSAQGPSPSSAFPRGSSQQSWQNAGEAAVLSKCKTKPAPFGIPISTAPQPATPPPDPPVATSPAIPGVIAAGQAWKTVWNWQGNNADGPIAGDGGTLLFANNDARSEERRVGEEGRSRG